MNHACLMRGLYDFAAVCLVADANVDVLAETCIKVALVKTIQSQKVLAGNAHIAADEVAGRALKHSFATENRETENSAVATTLGEAPEPGDDRDEDFAPPIARQGVKFFNLGALPGCKSGASAGDDGTRAAKAQMVGNPVWSGNAVGVNEEEILPRGEVYGIVERNVLAPSVVGVPRMSDAHLWMIVDVVMEAGDGGGVGAVVGYDDFKSLCRLEAQAFKAQAQPLKIVVCGHNDRYIRCIDSAHCRSVV